jgi:hypothetical protein
MEADSTDSTDGAAQYQRERLLYSGREDRGYCTVAERTCVIAQKQREERLQQSSREYRGYCTVAEGTEVTAQ